MIDVSCWFFLRVFLIARMFTILMPEKAKWCSLLRLLYMLIFKTAA